jgi:phosphoglycerate dehydrogenase-like enzyme
MNVKVKVTSPSFSISEILRSELKKEFNNVEFNDEGKIFSEHDLIDYLFDANGAVIGLEKMTANVLSNLPNLKIISKYGVGLDNIDLDYCNKNNIELGWTGGVNKRSAAELTLCFMLGLSRNVFYTSQKLKNSGIWNKNGGFQLTGKTVGIIGFGNVGKEVAKLLQPFHCKVLANDIIDQKQYYFENGVIESSKEEIFYDADIISLHVPCTKLTRKMITASTFSKMKNTSYLINVARGELINQKVLKLALDQNEIAGAAIDVFEIEPPKDYEFIATENLFCTPHIGGNAEEAILSMGRNAIYHLCQFFHAK